MSDDIGKLCSVVTDAVTQTNTGVVGIGPALAANQSYLGQAQAQSVLFANMVSHQKQMAMTSLSTAAQSARQILNAENKAHQERQELNKKLDDMNQAVQQQINLYMQDRANYLKTT